MINTNMKKDFWWNAPEYFSRWRVFPRAFITMYIYLLWKVVTWFMALPDPSLEQSGLVSVIVGAGAAWFGLYVNSGNNLGNNPPPQQSQTQPFADDYSNGYRKKGE